MMSTLGEKESFISNTRIKRRLDTIAKKINELDELLKERFDSDAYIYFEGEGQIHAMKGDDGYDTSFERQKMIVASSDSCSFECGAW
jgi:hypothetical protein